jgi:uncharacterized protein (DUF779 family)
MPGRVTVTPQAAAAIRELTAAHGPLVFHQSGGCCDGSSPMCLLAAELPPGPSDVLLGEIEGAPFYIDGDQDARWGNPAFLIDVAPGAATSLSLEGSGGVHFVARSPATSAIAAEGNTP